MNGVHRPTGDHHPGPDAQAAPRVALYTRGYEPSTLDRQDAALRQYLATHRPDWRVVAVYRDTAPTDGWRDIRPGLRAALAAAGAGRYDVLLVQQPDRLSRRVEQLATIIAVFEAASVTVCCTTLSDSPLAILRLLLWAASFADGQLTVVATRPHEQHTAARHQPGTAAPVAVPDAPTRLALTAHPLPGPEVAMARIIRSIDRGTRTVDGVDPDHRTGLGRRGPQLRGAPHRHRYRPHRRRLLRHLAHRRADRRPAVLLLRPVVVSRLRRHHRRRPAGSGHRPRP